jgi:uncharacterized protein YcfL
MKKLIIILLLFLVGCKTTQQILPPDTVKQIEYKTKFVNQYVTIDSIVFKDIPCDPVDSIIFKTKTIYKTKVKEVFDTVFLDKEIIKTNPINSELQEDNIKLTAKNSLKNRAILILSILLLIFVLLKFV